ncbi:hypothetical protein M422DRAFT_185368, partial [Sphaerobolus stellatus SS14]
PQWLSKDVLLFLNDSEGYSNLWSYSLANGIAERILPQVVKEDFSEPAWTLGRWDSAPLDPNTVLYSSIRDGRSILSILNFKERSLKYLPTPYATIKHIRRLSPNEAAFIAKKEDASTAIFSFPLSSNDHDGAVHVLYFPPLNPKFTPSSGELPPSIISVHGGPTDRADMGLDWMKQFWTSRGWAWVDVNYGGSSGYGKSYRDRLRGNWGIVDVEDTIFAVKALCERKLIDPQRIALRGESAGGFTVLAALVKDRGNFFKAATSCFGVSDLIKLTTFTHKFESRYFEVLIGGTPENNRKVYLERSPISHAEKICTPLLVLQGSRDPIVLPDQSETIAKSIEEHGGQVKYMLFDGESHGWRKPETIRNALETELAWYQGVFGLNGENLKAVL